MNFTNEYSGEYESLQSLHSWHIQHLSQSHKKFNYAEDIEINITDMGVELILLPPKKGELGPLLEYLLDCLRGQLTEEGISHTTELSYILQRVSTLWTKVKKVHSEFKNLAQMYRLLFTVSDEGDLVVKLSILKRLQKLQFEVTIGSDLLVDLSSALRKARIKTDVIIGEDVNVETITQSLMAKLSNTDDKSIVEAFDGIVI